MILQKTAISDNFSLSSIHTDKFKTGTLTLSIYLPLTQRDYLLSLLLAGVMRRGTRSYPSMAMINKRLDELYAANVDVQSVIHGNILTFCVSAEFLENRFSIDGTDISANVFDVLSELLLSPLMQNGSFLIHTVESEKTIIKDSLLAEKNNTKLYAATRLKELMCRSGNISFPTLEYLLREISAITVEELTSFYLKLISTSPFNAFYVGSESSESIGEKLLRSFSNHNGTQTFELSHIKAATSADFLSVTEDMPVSQGKLALGFRTGAVLGSSDDAAAIVLNEVFGATPASKLFLNVRERSGLCYYCASSYSLLSGNLTVSSGIDVKNRDRATDEILAQLDEIRNGNVSDAELEVAKRSLEYSYVQIYDSPFSLQSFFSVRDLVGVYETVDECKARILAVKKEDVCELARRTVFDTCFFINGTLSDNEETEEEAYE